MSARRVAIVGFGPRGVGALERLIAHHRAGATAPIELTVYEPHEDHGAGHAYARAQPPYLLMNFPAARIDLSWPAGAGPPSALGIGSFVDWLGADPDRAERWYPPRALVGRYLAAAAARLLRTAPFAVELLPERVVEIGSEPDGWRLSTASGRRDFDEVLLAVGHAAPRRAGTEAAAAPGSRVGTRGFGLTAIDLILDLTEGRGGRFEPLTGGGLRYLASGREPAAILPRSRTGRPMLAKPELAHHPRRAQLSSAVEASRQRIRRIDPGLGIDELAAAIASLCAELLSPGEAAGAAAAWVAAAAEGRLRPEPDPAGALARSLRIDRGEAEPELSWALGIAWREVYPAIVERFSHGGLPARERLRFRRLSAELERLAFGPPPLNAAKLLALREAGILDLSRLGRQEPGPVDAELDAVIAPPGLPAGRPLTGLRDEGAIRVPAGSRGIEVSRAGRCVGAGGAVTAGLSACGRLTEDWVIGNDTLNRGLHPEVDGWAASVAAAAAPDPVPVVAS